MTLDKETLVLRRCIRLNRKLKGSKYIALEIRMNMIYLFPFKPAQTQSLGNDKKKFEVGKQKAKLKAFVTINYLLVYKD